MQIYVSYFYSVRFFKPNMVPFSTAMWDPKWYHAGQNQSYVFVDKRGVINGMRADPLVPDKHCEGLCRGPEACANGAHPESCQFLKAYMQQLEAIPIHSFVSNLEHNALFVMQRAGIEGDPVAVILVHEAPTNPCSERGPLIKWFRDAGYDVGELDFHHIGE